MYRFLRKDVIFVLREGYCCAIAFERGSGKIAASALDIMESFFPALNCAQGDGGSPLVSNFDTDAYTGREVLQGIVSVHSSVCTNPVYPAIYTRVSKFCNWLLAQTQDEVTCWTG